MRSLITVAVLSLASATAFAQAGKSCDDLKAEIAKKIEANGVKTYTLDVVPTDKTNDAKGKVVGSCEGGAKKIVYSRGTDSAESTAKAPAAEPSKQ
jgi:Protein of unknown function (DUF1161)